MNVLIVDDEKLICWSLKKIFERKKSWFINCAYSADEALKELGNNSYDVVITDLRLPDAQNLEIVGKIRETAAEIPVIVMSGYLSKDVERYVMRQGAFKCISKPFDIEDILSDVGKALGEGSMLFESSLTVTK